MPRRTRRGNGVRRSKRRGRGLMSGLKKIGKVALPVALGALAYAKRGQLKDLAMNTYLRRGIMPGLTTRIA